ncbi:MAG: murein biosynthesis integral membrane protein MurJ [Deltaproteobacteria bacterium]|nr:murein biosynthesis integral membrane protein MurJ [Deltaproteobacteria bacterium]
MEKHSDKKAVDADPGLSEPSTLARSAGLVGLLTLASRVLGLVRDSVVAAFFRKEHTDAFFVAFTIPNVLRRLLAEGALTVAFIPVYTEYLENKGKDAARQLLANTLGATLLALLIVTTLGEVFAPQLVWLFAEGLGEGQVLATLLTRLMFPFLVTVALVALAMGVLNTHRHFLAPAVAPVLLNVGIIGSVMLGVGQMVHVGLPRVGALALGVIIGGVLQLLLQLAPLAKRDALLLPRFGLAHPGVVRIAKLMLPSLFGLAIYQINIVLSRRFASFLPDGSISVLYYAQRLIEFPLGVFAVAIATVSMPNLSGHAKAGEMDKVKATYRFAQRIAIFLMLPATAGLWALGEPLASVLFQRGAFTHEMAQQTGITLAGFALGLLAAGGVRQTAPVFFALEDTRTPVAISAVALVVFVLAALVLKGPLGTLGLALAVALASSVNFVLMVTFLRRRIGPLGLHEILNSTWRAALASVACGLVAWQVAGLGRWEEGGGALINYVMLVMAVAAGGLAYVIACRLLGSPELGELLGAMRRRGRAK